MYQINKPYVRDSGRNYTPIYVPGETYSLYFVPDVEINEYPFAGFYPITYNFGFRIIDYLGNIIYDWGYTNVLQYLLLNPILPLSLGTGNSGTSYHIYSTFVFPDIKGGQYQFEVYTSQRSVMRSNAILCCTDNIIFERSCICKFRNNDILFGVRYDLLPNFQQIFRLPLNQIKQYQAQSERDTYRESSNGRNVRTSKSFLDKKITLEGYFLEDEALDAFAVMFEHDTILIDGLKIIAPEQIRTEEVSFASNRNKFTNDVLLDEFNLDFFFENYGEGILFGGTPGTLATDVIIGLP